MKKILSVFTLLFALFFVRADEGMWIPLLLQQNEAEMQQLGFKLTAEDIYSINHHSMKDAIMLFGGGCTGELISENGLVLTNHHCGYSYVQRLSSIENNYLHDGFWAKNRGEELACPGLSVTFLVRMEDVTSEVLRGVEERMNEKEREDIVNQNISRISSEAVQGTHYEAVIKPFFYGNQYFLFVNETFKDVRLVGVPPESIGKFGGDTDNWVWPRHTGDFALYRIYTDNEGLPATYHQDNIPLRSKQFFSFSLKGVEEKDFTLVFGYPGTTEQFLISDEVDIIANTRNPIAIKAREIRLNAMKKWMEKTTETRLMYSAKANSISNGWKKWIGESKGINDCNVINMKKAEELDFISWLNEDPVRVEKYGAILPNMHNLYNSYKKNVQINTFNSEVLLGSEILRFLYLYVTPVVEVAKNSPESFPAAKEKLITQSKNFFKNYNVNIDKECFVNLLFYYFSTQNPELIPTELHKYINISENSLEQWWDKLGQKSPFLTSEEKFLTFLENATAKQFSKLGKNEIFIFLAAVEEQYHNNYNQLVAIKKQLNMFYRTYVTALMEKEPKKHFYPDANLTMRVTYGQVEGFSPADGVQYCYYTTSDGILAKENPAIFDYKVDSKLKKLFEARDFGEYANAKGELPVGFIASNHTTGGNSGSPVINANGELIGINFDRVWEGTMSDIHYDKQRCRNISLDVRYLLFIIDKYADAQNIMSELTIKK